MTRLEVLLAGADRPEWEVAMAVGMHPSALSRAKTGRRPLLTRHAVRLADFFGVTVDDVRGAADEEWRAKVGT